MKMRGSAMRATTGFETSVFAIDCPTRVSSLSHGS